MQELMIQTGSLIAGSAALALYLKQEGIDPAFEPHNINIFTEADEDDCIATYLSNSGYVEAGSSNNYDIMHWYTVQIFVHSDHEREIHLIRCGESPLQYIMNKTDLSCCCTWWNAAVNQFATVHPTLTKQKLMFYKNYHADYAYKNGKCTNVQNIRRATFQERGFKMTKRFMHPIGLEGNDSRELVYLAQPNKLTNKLTDSKVDCCTYLASSPFHILVYYGHKYHAFHRDILHYHLKSHVYQMNKIGKVYSMPFRQVNQIGTVYTFHLCLTEHAMCMLSYDDYSVYELVMESSPVNDEEDKGELISVCRLKCYTVEEWDLGVTGLVVEPESE